jgi:hypothetical protein
MGVNNLTSRQEHSDEREAYRPLRQRLIEDRTVRNFVEKMRNDYIRSKSDPSQRFSDGRRIP